MLSLDEMTLIAAQRMKDLKISKNCINAFKKGNIWLSERQNQLLDGILYEINDNKVLNKINDLQKEYNILIYHIQLTHTTFGDLYSMLYVSNDKSENRQDEEDLRNGEQLVYVFNYDDEVCSEFGYIGVEPKNGGITRTY